MDLDLDLEPVDNNGAVNSTSTATDQFTNKTNSFLAWLVTQADAIVHPGIEIADLRAEGAGRGVGS